MQHNRPSSGGYSPGGSGNNHKPQLNQMKKQTNVRVPSVPVVRQTMLAILATLCFAGCGEQTAGPSTKPPAPAAEAPKAPAETKSQTEAVKSAVTEANTQAQNAADTAKAQATSTVAKAQSMIDEARKLIANEKINEAVTVLNVIANLKLTPEQQALVDNLKQKAQKFLADAAAKKATEGASKAIGDALKPKP